MENESPVRKTPQETAASFAREQEAHIYTDERKKFEAVTITE